MKKNLISIVILALLIANIVLTAIMMFSVASTNKKTAALVTDIASAISLDLGTTEGEAEQKPAVPMANVVSYTIADMMIPLKIDNSEGADGKKHYAQLSVTLSMDSKHKAYKTFGADISSREDLIKGEITEVVSQFTLAEADENPQMVKEEILKGIQRLFDSDFIFDVSLISPFYQ